VVEPECRLILVGKVARVRRNMFVYATQGFVDRKLVYEGQVLGMVV
jgi:3-hydroxymyristoyl/3-hydroxydecanoyl-(acyl carrier protein) dehydratase